MLPACLVPALPVLNTKYQLLVVPFLDREKAEYLPPARSSRGLFVRLKTFSAKTRRTNREILRTALVEALK
jgi:hypothetical protein